MKPSLGMSHTERGSSEFALRRSPRLLGKFGLRRSPRLLGKSAMSIPKRSQISPRKSTAKGKSAMTMPEHSQISICKPREKLAAKGRGTTFCGSGSPGGIETNMRLNREHKAQHFRRNYAYRDDLCERKTCIHPGGDFSWEGKSSGFTWVAVRGRNTTCVVFKRTLEYVENRLRSYLVYNMPEITFNLFGLTAISDIEVLADLPNEVSQNFESCGQRQHVHKPFAIVSVDPSNLNGLVKNDDEKAAVEYLKGILTKDKDLYSSETEEIAIRAFQLLYDEKFEADDIWVTVASLGEEMSLPSDLIKGRLRIIEKGEDEPDHGWIKRFISLYCPKPV